MNKKPQEPKQDWGFYAVTPRIVRTQYKDLSHAEKWLYTCLKDLCGDKGSCFRSLRSLSEETDISIASLSKMIPHLHSKGLIHAEKKRRSASGKEVWHISIVDIWQENAKYCKDCSKNEQSHEEDTEVVQNMNKVVQNMNDVPPDCSKYERGCSNFSDRSITSKDKESEEYKCEEESIASETATLSSAPIVAPSPSSLSCLSSEETKAKASSKKKEKVIPPKKAELIISDKARAVWNIWCSMPWNKDVQPKLSETAARHCETLANAEITEDIMFKVKNFATSKKNDVKGFYQGKAWQLGNVVAEYPKWKSAQMDEESNVASTLFIDKARVLSSYDDPNYEDNSFYSAPLPTTPMFAKGAF